MSQDNVRLALWISGAWGLAIILIVGVEAIVHDGPIAATIVDTFSKVLFGLGAILGAITGVGKWVEGHVAAKVVASPTAAAALPAFTNGAFSAALPQRGGKLPAPEPVSNPAGVTADLVPGGGA